MARSGDVLEHPVTGERLVWRRVANESDGRLLEGDVFARPGGHPAAAHVHPNQEERFRVLHGSVRLRVGRQETLLGPRGIGRSTAGSPPHLVERR